MKLYRSRKYSNRWYAFGPEIGWVMFPASADGWQKREPARGLDPMDVREVPITLAFPNGLPSLDVVLEDAA
jgi:hypothetical protein